MKKSLVPSLVIILFFISACGYEKTESFEVYEKAFTSESENWEIKLHLKELNETWWPEDLVFYEEDILTFKYLKEIEEDLEFHYEWVFGEYTDGSTVPGYKISLTQHNSEYIDIQYQQRMIEEVCFGQLKLLVIWKDKRGESQEENFVFKDKQNPQCENIVLMAPRGDINY